MTNSSSSAVPSADIPADGIVVPPTGSAKPRRTGSRRVSLPAGAPSKAASAAPALLIFGSDGKPLPQATDDVAPVAATDTAPSADGVAEATTEGESAQQEQDEAPAEAKDAAVSADSSEATEVASKPDDAQELENQSPAEPQAADAEAADVVVEPQVSPISAPPADAEPVDAEEVVAEPGDQPDSEPEDTEQVVAEPDVQPDSEPEAETQAPVEAASPAASDAVDQSPAAPETATEPESPSVSEQQLDSVPKAPSPAEATPKDDAPSIPAPEIEDALGTGTEPAIEAESAAPEAAADVELDAVAEPESIKAQLPDASAVVEIEPVAEAPAPEALTAVAAIDPEAGDVPEQAPSVDSPATEPDLEPAPTTIVAPEEVTPGLAVESSPVSRRERRLAEQKALDAVVPARRTAIPAAPVPQTTPAPLPVLQPGKPSKKRNKLWAYLRGGLLFVAIAAVVLGLGTVVTGQHAPVDGPSATETTRQQVWAESKALLVTAQELSNSATNDDSRALLTSTVTALEIQIAALANGLPNESTAPSPSASPAPVATTQGLATALAANANVLLGAAVTAEGSMGRVFASAGTGQLLQATALSLANGLPAPSSPFLSETTDNDLPSVPVCNTLLKPQPGVSSDAALIAAAEGELKAIFAYQVSTTRLAEPTFSKSKQLLAGHQLRLELLNRELALRCLPQVAPVPGFVLDSAFTATPKKALSDLEGQLTVLYGDTAALSKPHQDAAAETGVAGTKESAYTANASALRELSVKWLLGSAINQQFWGGTSAPLPGISGTAPSSPATGPASSAP
ncbi:DUF4439 domain-containing protein [Arthrobacter sp. GMC3]|uniref:DUF4439 domain-containing protein n=1 Tax=Arthrobacter sp. GMC3 TaxID=2058894 RepID=UPI0015E3F815|nr:DUF4439 domain-containing protein [Arthrobacter sp. GMC3]